MAPTVWPKLVHCRSWNILILAVRSFVNLMFFKFGLKGLWPSIWGSIDIVLSMRRTIFFLGAIIIRVGPTVRLSYSGHWNSVVPWCCLSHSHSSPLSPSQENLFRQRPGEDLFITRPRNLGERSGEFCVTNLLCPLTRAKLMLSPNLSPALPSLSNINLWLETYANTAALMGSWAVFARSRLPSFPKPPSRFPCASCLSQEVSSETHGSPGRETRTRILKFWF